MAIDREVQLSYLSFKQDRLVQWHAFIYHIGIESVTRKVGDVEELVSERLAFIAVARIIAAGRIGKIVRRGKVFYPELCSELIDIVDGTRYSGCDAISNWLLSVAGSDKKSMLEITRT